MAPLSADRISVFGLGRLGLPVAAALACEFSVVGIDIDAGSIQAVQAGEVPPRVCEPGLGELLREVAENLMPTTDPALAMHTGISIILVPTPSESSGGFSLRYVLEVCETLGEILRQKVERHVVVVASTVMPGSCGGPIREVLEGASGRTVGQDLGLCYCPEFVALGNVLEGLRTPDFVLVGASDVGAYLSVEAMYKQFCLNDPPIVATSLVNAELAKLALNCYVTAKITFANQLAELCERVPGADVDEVTRAIGLDSRIGGKYLVGATAFGGPCLLPSALVQTSVGLKRIDEIQIGDSVLGHTGDYHKVMEIHTRNYQGQLIEIVPGGFFGQPIIVTPEHPIWGAKRLCKRNGDYYRKVKTTGKARLSEARGYDKLDFLPAYSLQVGDLLALPALQLEEIPPPIMTLRTHHLSYVAAETIITPELMKVFGFYISEGSSWGKEVKFSFHEDEIHYVSEIDSVISKHFGSRTKVHSRHGKGIAARTTCSALAGYLRLTFGHRAEEKRVPHKWLALPRAHLVELLRGIWYGDGSNSGGSFIWATVSKELFNFMKLAFLRLKIGFTTKTYASKTDKNSVHHQKAYFLCVHNPRFFAAMNELLPELAVELRGKGKKTTWFENGVMLYHIKRLDHSIYAGKVYNLEVEGTASYMVESGVLHNCFPRDNRALALVAQQQGVRFHLAEIVDELNAWQIERLARMVWGKTGILGLTYKLGTNVTVESPGMALLDCIPGAIAFDPVVQVEQSVSSAQDCVDRVDTVIIALPCPEFKLLRFREGQVVIDCWRLLDREMEGICYIPIGVWGDDEQGSCHRIDGFYRRTFGS